MKRSSEAEIPEAARMKMDTEEYITMKSLISLRQTALIVGEAEKTINVMKKQTSASIQVSDHVPGAIERILTVTGEVSAVAQTYKTCIQVMLGEDINSLKEEEGFEFTLKIILSHVYVEAIKDVKCHVSEFLLPLSSERAVTITGTPTTISSTLTEIGAIMLPLKSKATAAISRPYTPVSMFGRYGHPDSFRNIKPHDTTMSPSNPYGIAPSQFSQETLPDLSSSAPQEVRTGPTRNSKEKLIQQIYIPNDMVGAIIGKQGSKINEIRNLSGTHIKINEPDPSRPNERLITVEGTGEQNQLALYMLYQRLESEKRRV